MAIETRSIAELVIPVAAGHGLVPLSGDEKLQPLASWKPLEEANLFWMARSKAGVTYLKVSGDHVGDRMLFRPGAGLTTKRVQTAPIEYSQGPASSLTP